MYKYGKYFFMAILLTGLFLFTYGGCGGSDDEGGTTTPNPTAPPPTTPAPTDNDTPPTDPPPTAPPTGCEGDAFGTTASAAAKTSVEGCITDFILETSDNNAVTCFCNASEAGNFIVTVPEAFLGIRTIRVEFPDPPEGSPPTITNFTFDWSIVDCDSIELFTLPSFTSPDPVSIGTLDDMSESAPDELTFTANVSEQFLSMELGNPGQSVSCDFCSIDNFPACAPAL